MLEESQGGLIEGPSYTTHNSSPAHFLLDCFKLQEVRNEFLTLQMPRPENSRIIISRILLLHPSKDELDKHYFKIVYKL